MGRTSWLSDVYIRNAWIARFRRRVVALNGKRCNVALVAAAAGVAGSRWDSGVEQSKAGTIYCRMRPNTRCIQG